VAFRTRWTRPHSRRLIPALALAAALATVLPAAACASAPASSGASSTADVRPAPSPAITAAQARQVFDHYVAVSGAETSKTGDPALALSLETGPRRAFDSASDSAALRDLNMSASAMSQALKQLVPPAYTAPTYYLPERSGYPHFFVVNVTRKLTSDYSAGAASPGPVDGAEIYPFGPELMLFEQASADAPWLLASTANLAVGETLPKLATDSAGYIPTVPLSDAALLAQPADAGPLQAAVVDDGSASAATRAVGDGPLTTGLYKGAVNHADELKAPRGDVYQWELEGTSYPEFALRTADGGALVFYTMTLNTEVAVPDYVNKANPIHSGRPIQVPQDVQELLPKGQPVPLVQLQSEQTLSFAAVDPVGGNAKVQVIAMGGGLTAASAS
jgi:hypothetical protein